VRNAGVWSFFGIEKSWKAVLNLYTHPVLRMNELLTACIPEYVCDAAAV